MVELFRRQVLDSRTSIVVGKVGCLGPRVSGSELRTGPPALEKHLQSIILRRPVWLNAVDVRCETELNGQRTTAVSGCRRAAVDVDAPHLIDGARAHVTSLDGGLPSEIALNKEVEGVNLFASWVLGEGGSARVRRKRNNPGVDVWRNTSVD